MSGNRRSFINRLVAFYDSYQTIRAGKESISVDARDLFINAYYHYIDERFNSFDEGIAALREKGIDRKGTMKICNDGEEGFSVRISHANGVKVIPRIERFFEGPQGGYNEKGYYDADAADRFMEALFSAFDEIIGD